jgi:Resolvase, N terminal domain
MNIGYARVSTQGQTLEVQLDQLRKAGCEQVYKEIASGARSDREQLRTLLKALEPGSTLVVTRLDRLARSTVDLLTTIKTIADRGCLFKSLADPWADTTTPALSDPRNPVDSLARGPGRWGNPRVTKRTSGLRKSPSEADQSTLKSPAVIVRAMSALPAKADTRGAKSNVCFGP